jgi:P27 family predicted phage terminase small subunit
MKGRKPDQIAKARQPFMCGKAPAWLSKEAKAEWSRCAPLLNERKTLTEGDIASFEHYCVACGSVRQAERLLQKEGLIITTTRGKRAHPALRIQVESMNRARLLAAELGLTPVSRSRPSIRDDGNEDPDSSALGL